MTTKKIIQTSRFPPAVPSVPGIGLLRRPMYTPYELPIAAADHLIGLGYAIEAPGGTVAPPPTPVTPSAVEPEPVVEAAAAPAPEEEEDPLPRIAEYLQSTSLEDLKSSLKGRIAEKRLEAIKESEVVTSEVVIEHLTSGQIDLLAELTQVE